MIPSSFQRGPRGRANLPLVWLVLGAVALVFVGLVGWVLLSMGVPPETTPVTADVAVKL